MAACAAADTTSLDGLSNRIELSVGGPIAWPVHRGSPDGYGTVQAGDGVVGAPLARKPTVVEAFAARAPL
jgi:hypothetical protein